MPLLLHAARRVRPASLTSFRARFAADASGFLASGDAFETLFAFPAPHDPYLHTFVAYSAKKSTELHPESIVRALGLIEGDVSSDAPASQPDSDAGSPEPFTHVYGARDDVEACVRAAAGVARFGGRLRCFPSAGGFARESGEAPPAETDSGAGPMIGFFRRRVRPGRSEALVRGFADVAEIWRRSIPGCLWASVARCDEDGDYVWDVRIFANRAAYAAHVDKSNAELTRKMETWFSNYDVDTAFSGALYGAQLAEKQDLSSSMRETKQPRQIFEQYDFKHSGLLGTIPRL